MGKGGVGGSWVCGWGLIGGEVVRYMHRKGLIYEQKVSMSAEALLSLEDRVAVVTGSTGGIGKAIAEALLDAGATVWINGRSEESCSRARDSILETREGCAERVKFVAADLGTAEGCTALVDAVGDVDVFVANFGVYEAKDFFSTTDEDWDNMWEKNVMSMVRTSRRVLRNMLDKNRGRLILIGSEAGVRTIPDMIPYSVSKSAVMGLGRAMAELTKCTAVTVNTVLAGPTATAGVTRLFSEAAEAKGLSIGELLVEREPSTLLGRLIDPREIAATVRFLASDGSAAITGAAIRAEGGIIRAIP